jgi:predicted DNA-binding WGR domain protein
MAWIDKYKTEQVLIQQEENHNKFWAAVVDEKTFKASIRWGRLGTKGQSQEKDFTTSWEAANFIDTKLREKRRKGYEPITKSAFDKLCIQSAIVGTANKCNQFEWVEIKGDNYFVTIDDNRLQNPDCNPGVYVEVETKKKYGGESSFNILFTFDKAYLIGPKRFITPVGLITKESPIYELTAKVEEAIGRSLSI